jgi:hypothetical protein
MAPGDFNLISGDGIIIPIDSQVLSIQSTVFNSMLSVPQPSDQLGVGECRVVELASDINLMLSALNNELEAIITTDQLLALTKMADKFDSPYLVSVVTARIW